MKTEGVRKAVDAFSSGFNCSQAVFSTYGPAGGLDEATSLKIAAPFGAGMGYMQETCGAVTGAFMAIGMRYGNHRNDDSESKEKAYRCVRKFARRFSSRNNSIRCFDLLGHDITTEKGLKEAREKNLFSTLCSKFVMDAAEILEEIFAEED